MPPEFAEFDQAEFETRWARARAGLAEAGLDALLITSESNYRYLSGHVTPFWVSKTRPLFFILPLHGQPVVLFTSSQEPAAAATSWVVDRRSWDGFAAPGIDLVAATLGELGLASGRIGAELGEEQRLGIPYTEFVRLQQGVPRATFVDAAPLLWRLRLIKSPAEITYLRRSATIASTAYRELFAAVRPGLTEAEAFAHFVASTIRQGAERPGYVPVHSGPGHYHRHTLGPTNRALRHGDLLWLDGGCVYRGYWSDFARLAAIGQATSAQRQHYRRLRAIMQAGVALLQPGASMGEVTRQVHQQLRAADLPFSATARLGHGLGLDITEPPSINASDPTIIEPGMVLTMEPTSATNFGFFQLEENVVITPSGPELLTEPAPAELPVL